MEGISKICPNCGTQNQGDARFCENCGTDLGAAGPNYAPGANSMQGNHGLIGQTPPNYSYNANHGYGTPPLQAQPAQKKQIPKWAPVVLAEAVVLALCIYGAAGILKKGNSPERVAENYFVHMANGDWEKGYAELDVEDSEFINAEMYGKAQAQEAIGVVTNYQVNSSSNEALDELSSELSGLMDDLGLGGYLDQGENSSLEEVVKIDYRVKGDTENSTFLAAMNQTPKGWKVSASGCIYKDYCLYVPKGASVSLDGISLGDKYFVPEEERESAEEFMDAYQIPQIFYGTHQIKVTMEDMEDVTETFEIDYGSSQYYIESMQIKEEVLDTLVQKAGDNMQQIYGAVMSGKGFKSVESLFTANEGTRKEIKASYEELLAGMNEGSQQPTKINFQNMEGSVYGSEVEVRFEYDMDYQYEAWWGEEWDTGTYTGGDEWYFQFVKEDGNWVQANLGCGPLYY